MAPTGSSTLILSKEMTEKTTMIPAIAPIIIELNGETFAQPAVIATRPARAPFKLIPASGFPNFAQETNIAKTAPVAAARFVFTKIMAISLFAAVVEPGLNPNHPNHKINIPRAAIGILCPRIGFIPPFFRYLPRRGPSTIVPARAAQPPTE